MGKQKKTRNVSTKKIATKKMISPKVRTALRATLVCSRTLAAQSTHAFVCLQYVRTLVLRTLRTGP